MGGPASGCMTFTRPDFILVPIPAASTIADIVAISLSLRCENVLFLTTLTYPVKVFNF